MPNPWLIVGVLLALAVAALGGYSHGINTERGDAAVRQQEAIALALAEDRERAEKEAARRQAQAVKNERAAAAAREAKLKGMLDAAENNRSECHWPERRRVLINAAVDAANANTDTAALGLRAPLPDAAAPGK